ncbi:MAG: sorbosone dehydrogenase, partial [Massilia sp.]|nr:sorbosone dehydrogenase [Massilia sp.]
MNKHLRLSLITLAIAATSGCAVAQAPAPAPTQGYAVGFGPNPQLPAQEKNLIPTVNIASAVGWPSGAKPTAAAGMNVAAYATGLDHPRWLYMLPNGDILVAETNKPPKEEKEKHQIKAAVMGIAMKKAGAGVESPNRITLLRGIGANGMAATKTVFMEGLNSPFGMTLVGNELFIANADAIVKVPYKTGDTKITAKPVKVADLPAGLNHHWTKNVIASKDGKFLYATVGSNSNVGENGMDKEEGRAAIWQFDRATGKGKIFASGLRNPNGLAWNPQSGMLWT